jgi:hypothetical protein
MTDGTLLPTVRRLEAADFLADTPRFRVTVAFLSVDVVMHEPPSSRDHYSRANVLREQTRMRPQVESRYQRSARCACYMPLTLTPTG